MCIHSWVVISLSNNSLWPNRTVGSCELVVVRRALWVGCCGLVGVGWSLVVLVGRCVGWSLRVSRCGSVAVDQSLLADCCGSVAVGMGRLLCVGRCGCVAVGTCFGSIVASIGHSVSHVVGLSLCWSVVVFWPLWFCCSIRSLRFGCDRSVNLSLWDDCYELEDLRYFLQEIGWHQAGT